MGELEQLKIRLREESSPFFTDDELKYYFNLYNKDLDLTTYKLLIMKSEEDSLTLNNTKMESNSNYWLRIAATFKPNKSRVL